MNVLERIDSTINLSNDERMIFDSVTSLAREKIAPRAAEYDRTSAFPWENVKAINELGLNAMFIPEEYGGAKLSFTCYAACVREKARLLPRVADGGLVSLAITESGAGSDAKGMRTTFTAHGDEIIINGNKVFITNGDVADLYLLFGKWANAESGKDPISVLVLEKGTPGLTVTATEHKMGTRASGTASLSFENCRVPRANLLGQPGDGLRILFGSLNRSRPSVAAHALGIARAAFEDAVAYINERKQSGKRIVEFQGIQFLLADLASELVLCESLLWRVAAMVDSGASDFGIEASILKLRATDAAMRITTDAVQLFGGYGYCSDYRVERLMRDAKITQIWEGTNQIHRQLIGRSFIQT